MILITGKSTLAQHISARVDNCVIVGKPDYDFSKKDSCNQLLKDFPKPDIIINTFATQSDDCWETLTTNYVSVAYLTVEYYKQLSEGQIINISSTSSWWPSYPDVPADRFYYGLSKLNLSEFGRNFNRVNIDSSKDIVVTTIEPGKFCSPMSNYAGMDIEKIVDLIVYAIDQKIHHLSLTK